jgi:hypothetical protein
MTIRKKSFASAPTEDAVAANVNADVFNENKIPFAHTTSVKLLEQSSSAQLGSTATACGYGQLNDTTAYSTGKPSQPPQQQQQQPRSSSVAVATGAPTSTQTTTIRCCTGLTCCGITCVILLTIFVCGAWYMYYPTL